MWKTQDWSDSELAEPLVHGPAHGVAQVLASLPPARRGKVERPQEEADLFATAAAGETRGTWHAPINFKTAELIGDEENDEQPLIISVDPNKTTLQGIALQYNVTTDALRKANGLTSDRLNSHFSLIIPRRGHNPFSSDSSWTKLGSEAVDPCMWIMRDETEARKRNAMEDAFVSMTRCRAGQPEARFYLSEHKYKLDDALAHYEKDALWEKQRRGSSFWSPWQ